MSDIVIGAADRTLYPVIQPHLRSHLVNNLDLVIRIYGFGKDLMTFFLRKSYMKV